MSLIYHNQLSNDIIPLYIYLENLKIYFHSLSPELYITVVTHFIFTYEISPTLHCSHVSFNNRCDFNQT